MAPFAVQPLLTGVKEQIDAILLQGDTLYLGTSTGTLLVHSIEREDSAATTKLLETKPNLTRRSIEQLGYLRDVNSLVVLSDTTVSLFPYPKLSPSTPLNQARNAFAFAIDSSIQLIKPESDLSRSPDARAQEGEPTVVTQLAIGCRRKIVIYTWKDGEAQDVKELSLPHTPRNLAFCNPNVLIMAYSATEHGIFYIDTMSVGELQLPISAAPSSGIGMGMGKVGGALTGFGGYMALGLGSKAAKPQVTSLGNGQVLVTKDSTSLFLGADGKPSRPEGIEWTGPPNETAFVKPYVLSVMPPGSAAPGPSQSSAHTAAPRVHIRSSISLALVQAIPFPFLPTNSTTVPLTTATVTTTLRVLSAASGSKSPAILVSTPNDKPTLTAEGSSIWIFDMQPWGEQIDQLVEAGEYADALELLETIDRAVLLDKDERASFIRSLHAVSLFALNKFDEAIDIFLQLDINPAKVVALFPESIAGRLAVPNEHWIPLFGGKSPPLPPAGETTTIDTTLVAEPDSTVAESSTSPVEGDSEKPKGWTDTLKLRSATLDLLKSGSKEDDTAEAKGKEKTQAELFAQSVNTLIRYLTDRRPKLSGYLASLHISPSKSFELPSLSEMSVEDLFALPNSPLSALVPDQLLRYAQIVDTALFQSYLAIRPAFIGPLCRVDNWCEVSEVEQVLRAKHKFSELIDLYRGKKMHQKALSLLHDLNGEETDLEDKVDPTIRYLQKLGPEYLDLIFESSRWVIEADHRFGLQIFTAEEAHLPRDKVADYLKSISPVLCIGFIEYLIDERAETDPTFHDILAHLYLNDAVATQPEAERRVAYAKFIEFINTSPHYRVDRLFSRLPPNSLYEARAILLGRLGNHDAALEIYVHRLQDYSEAEEYCKRIYQTDPDPRGVFLKLLRIYLQSSPIPSTNTSRSNLLEPALDLISRHSPRLDAVEALELLPPLVTASAVREFLSEALREPKIETRVIREIWEARGNQVDSTLMSLQTQRVKVTDSRICPQCHKRLGYSAISVHAPRGEVTHYQCREPFSRKLKDMASRRKV